jgi:hypothetical protein
VFLIQDVTVGLSKFITRSIINCILRILLSTALRRFVLEKLIVAQLVKKSPAFLTHKLITVFTRLYKLTLY